MLWGGARDRPWAFDRRAPKRTQDGFPRTCCICARLRAAMRPCETPVYDSLIQHATRYCKPPYVSGSGSYLKSLRPVTVSRLCWPPPPPHAPIVHRPPDIKEATFVGSDDRVVAAGSDCGRVFLYDAASGAVLRALNADEDVANCVQVRQGARG